MVEGKAHEGNTLSADIRLMKVEPPRRRDVHDRKKWRTMMIEWRKANPAASGTPA